MIKKEVYEDIIKKYKEILLIDGFFQEDYKWIALKEFGGRPDTNAANFGEEVRSIKFYNLIFERASGAIRHICDAAPEEYRQVIKVLFDESKSLNFRVSECTKMLEILYAKIASDNDHKHHHGEREFATFLTYKYPDKCTLYKDSFYQDFCKALDIKAASAKEKYSHYLSLVHEFIQDGIKSDKSLLDMYKSMKPSNGFSDINYTLLAQDILYRVFEVYNNENTIELNSSKIYKLSMGDFNKEDFEDLLSKKRVAVHKDTKAKGRSTLTQSDEFQNAKEGSFFILNHGNGIGAVKLIGQFSNDKVLTKKDGWLEREFKMIARALVSKPYKAESKWWTPNNNSTFVEIPSPDIDLANKLLFNEYFGSSFVSNDVVKGDAKNAEEISMSRINIPKNLILHGPPGTGKTYQTIERSVLIANPSFSPKASRDEFRIEYERLVEAEQIVFTTFHQSMSYEDFIEGLKPELAKNIDGEVRYKIEAGIFKNICDDARLSSNDTDDVSDEDLEFIDKYDVFLEFIRETLKVDSLYTLDSRKDGVNVFIDGISDQGNFSVTHKEGKRSYTVSKERLRKLNEKLPDVNEVTSVNKQFREIIGGSNSTAYWAVLNAIQNFKLKQKKDTTHKTIPVRTEKNFVLIIDEINRGNVSQIFGELITLIEDDKRLGGKEALKVTLPYSKKFFGVPSNLYIIGTMNTADRSVEALDTALRRRFVFEEITPKPKYLENSILKINFGIDIEKILEAVNRRLEALLDKDHQIGHSFFINVSSIEELKIVWGNKIIPLLQEYFFGDFGKIGLVLGKSFLNVDKEKITSVFADFDGYNLEDIEEKPIYIFEDISALKPEEFVEALNSILKSK